MLVAGETAGITSWVAATPLDVIKSRMQMGGAEAEGLRGAAGLHGEQRPAGGLGVFFRGAHHQQCPCLSRQHAFASYEHTPPPGGKPARRLWQLPGGTTAHRLEARLTAPAS